VVLIDWAWNYWTFARHARVVAQGAGPTRPNRTSAAPPPPTVSGPLA
jgi:hypothetical protein